MKVVGSKAIIHFDYTGSGLMVKGKELTHFEMAASDKMFFPAKAGIRGNTVVVTSKDVKEPVAVRYAWADNPEDANLFNKEGLPVGPFRTDDWPGITE